VAANAPGAEVCPACKGFGVLETPEGRVITCRCRAAGLAEARMRAAEIPERYLNCKVENYDLKRPGASQSHMRASLIARKFIEEWKTRDRGLMFVGPVGVGKTHLSVAILKTLIEDWGVRGLFCDFSDLLERIQATFSRTNPDSADDVLAPYRDAELLVLDELGARRPTDWVRDVLYGLINTRYNRQRLTIVTSNYSDAPVRQGEEKLEDRIGTMVRSRLYEMCDLVVLDGLDYRAWRAVKV
jgi:DNA replication protein DnaC